MEIIDLQLTSKRNTEIPCTITLPDNRNNMPLVLMAHGFCATRNENGTFTMLAKRLSKAGIATIRCDFAGCGDSKETHANNNLSNNMDNLDTLLNYMFTAYSINKDKIAVQGYSMGGKVTLHYTKRHPEIHIIGLWAPAAMNGDHRTSISKMIDENYPKMKPDDVYSYDNPFDNRIIPLGYDFFDQMIHSQSEEYFKEYEHNCIWVNGTNDDMVPSDLQEELVKKANPKANFVHHVVQGANHGFGAWDNHPEQMEELVNTTADFLIPLLTE